MSYSSCIICGTMVSYYEKYCDKCLTKHHLKQDENWGRGYHDKIDIDIEMQKDKINE